MATELGAQTENTKTCVTSANEFKGKDTPQFSIGNQYFPGQEVKVKGNDGNWYYGTAELDGSFGTGGYRKYKFEPYQKEEYNKANTTMNLVLRHIDELASHTEGIVGREYYTPDMDVGMITTSSRKHFDGNRIVVCATLGPDGKSVEKNVTVYPYLFSKDKYGIKPFVTFGEGGLELGNEVYYQDDDGDTHTGAYALKATDEGVSGYGRYIHDESTGEGYLYTVSSSNCPWETVAAIAYTAPIALECGGLELGGEGLASLEEVLVATGPKVVGYLDSTGQEIADFLNQLFNRGAIG